MTLTTLKEERPSLEDLRKSGTKVGRMTTTGLSEKRPHGKDTADYLEVLCECGNKKYVSIYTLRYRTSESCGCLQVERSTKHGMAPLGKHTRFYDIWSGMLYRCNNPKNTHWSSYGGRGIKVCERWHDFMNFKEDMLESYEIHVSEYGERQTTIERVNNDGNYEPENCTWATREEQQKNKRPRKDSVKKAALEDTTTNPSN